MEPCVLIRSITQVGREAARRAFAYQFVFGCERKLTHLAKGLKRTLHVAQLVLVEFVGRQNGVKQIIEAAKLISAQLSRIELFQFPTLLDICSLIQSRFHTRIIFGVAVKVNRIAGLGTV